MTIEEAFAVAAKNTDIEVYSKIQKALNEQTNPIYAKLLEVGILMGGLSSPNVLLILFIAIFHAGQVYGESLGETKMREELEQPFEALGRMPGVRE